MEYFGLVASILQVIDFGTKFTVTTIAFYKGRESTPDFISELENLKASSKDFNRLLGSLKTDDDGLVLLIGRCSSVLERVFDTIDEIIPLKRGNLWKAIKSAVQVYWKESDLQSLQNQLNDLRSQIVVNFCFTIWKTTSAHREEDARRHHQLMEKMNELDRGPILPIDESQIGSSIIQLVTRVLGQEDSGNVEDQLRTHVIHTMLSGENDVDTIPIIHLTDARRAKVEALFLATLHYDSMSDRKLAIPEAHEATFQWIFKSTESKTAEWDSFTHWLESDQQLYWITGKAGSGKSTLMKFLAQPIQTPNGESGSQSRKKDCRCTEHLRRWAGEQRLVMASFYFWAAGSSAQKSQTGLFKTLLSQLLHAFPEAIPFTSPKRWAVLSLFNGYPLDLTEQELHEMFKRAVQHISSEAKVVLFVDGLDEYDGNPDLLIDTMLSVVSNSTSVKLCVASRPWIEFEEKFKHEPSLRLQDLTYSDIKNYVEAKFNENANFAALRERDASYSHELINTVVQKSSGVFLWVQIVVASLLAGLSRADRLSDLLRRLDLLPKDLKSLYDRILDDIDDFYLPHAAKYFYLMAACPEPPPALLFSLTDQENILDLNALRPSLHFSKGELSKRVQDINIRLNSRCKGLLEVVGSLDIHRPTRGLTLDLPGPKIQYLHRTVQEYIESLEAKEKLGCHLPRSFDPHLNLLYGNILLYGACKSFGSRMSLKRVMHHAAQAHPDSAKKTIDGLDRLRCVASSGDTSYSEFLPELRAINAPYHFMEGNELFLCLAIECGVIEYINAKVESNALIKLARIIMTTHYESTLQFALHHLNKSVRGFFKDQTTITYSLLHIPFLSHCPLPSDITFEIVDSLLKKGADPNERYELNGSTPWRMFVKELFFAFFSESPTRLGFDTLGKIARLMIDKGAYVNSSELEAALKIMVYNKCGEYELTLAAQSVQEAVYSALRKLKKNRTSTQIEFDKQSQKYLGGGFGLIRFPGR